MGHPETELPRVAVAVVAHTARAEQAHQLQDTVRAAYLSMDNGALGCENNHRKAWAWLAGRDTDWSIVLEDDAQPVTGFREQAAQALAAAPTPIVSFYLGRLRPPHWQPQIEHAITKAQQENACYITSTHLLHAVAVAIKTEHIPDMLDLTKNSIHPWDYRVGAWAQYNWPQGGITYTNPSLVDHADTESIARHPDRKPRTPGRKAWTVGTRPTWTTKAVHLV